MWSTIFFGIAALIFIVVSLGAWKWDGDFEGTNLGLFFVALGLLIGPLVSYVSSRNG